MKTMYFVDYDGANVLKAHPNMKDGKWFPCQTKEDVVELEDGRTILFQKDRLFAIHPKHHPLCNMIDGVWHYAGESLRKETEDEERVFEMMELDTVPRCPTETEIGFHCLKTTVGL